MLSAEAGSQCKHQSHLHSLSTQSSVLSTTPIYSQRFGSLSRAYQLVGFGNADRLEFMELNRRLRRHSAEVRVLRYEC